MGVGRLISNRRIWKGFVKKIGFGLSLESLGAPWFILSCLMAHGARSTFLSQLTPSSWRVRTLTFISHRQLPGIGPGSQSVLRKCCFHPINNDDRRRKSPTHHIRSIYSLSGSCYVSGDLIHHLTWPFPQVLSKVVSSYTLLPTSCLTDEETEAQKDCCLHQAPTLVIRRTGFPLQSHASQTHDHGITWGRESNFPGNRHFWWKSFDSNRSVRALGETEVKNTFLCWILDRIPCSLGNFNLCS